jgi:hypothetical protein
MPVPIAITNFGGGEFSPKMRGRADIARYHSACSVLENFLTLEQGPIQTRPGTKYVAEVKNSTARVRMIPFRVSETLSYVIEAGNLYFRFYRNDGTDPGRIESGGSPVEVVTPYTTAQLREIQFVQIINTMYLVHSSHAPRQLVRTSDTEWELSEIDFKASGMGILPFDLAANITLSAQTGDFITITASASVFLEGDLNRTIEIPSSAGAGKGSIIGVSSPTIIYVSVLTDFDAAAYSSGDWQMGGSPYGSINTSINGSPSVVPKDSIAIATSASPGRIVTTLIQESGSCPSTDWVLKGGSEYYLKDTGEGYTADKPIGVSAFNKDMTEGVAGSLTIGQWGWGDPGTGYDTIHVFLNNGASPDTLCGNQGSLMRYIQFFSAFGPGAPVGPVANLFRSEDVGKFLTIDGIATMKIKEFVNAQQVNALVINERDSTADTFDFLIETSLWDATLGYPGVAGFHDGRLLLAATSTFPQTVWFSNTGEYLNFAKGALDAQGITVTLASGDINNVQWLASRNSLLIGTEGGESSATSAGAVITPSDISVKRQTDNGSKRRQASLVEGSVLFLTPNGRRLPELDFNFDAQGYVAPDRTLLAEHVTEGGIEEMDYARDPLKTLWMVRADGQLVAFQYMKAEQIVSFSRHITDGEIESVAVIPHPTKNYDEVWIAVKRTINSVTKRYVEAFAAMFDPSNASDVWQMDSGIKYVGASTSTISGLSHLEGKTVRVVSDGATIGGEYTVTSGQIDLGDREVDGTASTVYIGLVFTSTMRKMPITTQQMAATLALKKAPARAKISLYRTIGGKVGLSPDKVDPLNLIQHPAAMSSSESLKTGLADITLPNDNSEEWELTVLQDIPMPMTVLAIFPEAEIAQTISSK